MGEAIILPRTFSGRDAAIAQNVFLQKVSKEVDELRIDGAQVDEVDAIGIGVLVMLERRLRSHGGILQLHNASPALEEILNRVRLKNVFCV